MCHPETYLGLCSGLLAKLAWLSQECHPMLRSRVPHVFCLRLVPSGPVPSFFALTAALRLLDIPVTLRFLHGTVPRLRGRRDLPGSWATLASVPRSLIPVKPADRGPGPSALRFDLPVVPSARQKARRPPRPVDSFGIPSRGPLARCLRFTPALARSRARLAHAGRPPPRRSGLSPRGLLSEISGRYLLPFRPGFSWRTLTNRQNGC
jgi:hypothetical protein